MSIVPVSAAGVQLPELVAQFAQAPHGEPVILSEDGIPVAALISIDELEDLRATRNAADLAEIALAERLNAGGTSVSNERMQAWMDALDAADADPTRASEILAPFADLEEEVQVVDARLADEQRPYAA